MGLCIVPLNHLNLFYIWTISASLMPPHINASFVWNIQELFLWLSVIYLNNVEQSTNNCLYFSADIGILDWLLKGKGLWVAFLILMWSVSFSIPCLKFLIYPCCHDVLVSNLLKYDRHSVADNTRPAMIY